jgi:ligand-binding SRPBCC domain-containing protein
MHTYRAEREQWMPQPVDVVLSLFSRPENLQVITPLGLDFRMVETLEALAAGSLIRYRLRWRWRPMRWNRPHGFVDREVAGPYALWNHEHWFISHDEGTTMRDRVTYALPLAWGGRLASWAVVKRDVEKIFDFRAETMRRLFPG